MSKNKSTLDGIEKSAILLIALGPEKSSKIFKHLKEDEIEQLTLEIANTGSISPQLKEDVLKEFYEVCLAQQYIAEGGIAYAKELLEKALGEKVVMTKNLEIKFERNGKERSEKHLSAGQRSICALCFRLALIKNMYEGNTPFLVLDDPFTTLDKEHMAKVQEILNALSKEMQMVYFTCHESRMI